MRDPREVFGKLVDPFTNGFRWVGQALGTQTQTAPNVLDRVAQGTVDLAQDGWGHALTRVVPIGWTVNMPAGDTPGTHDLLTGTLTTSASCPTPDPTQQICVLALSVVLAQSAAAADAWLQSRAGPEGTAIIHSRATVPNQWGSLATMLTSLGAGNERWLGSKGHVWVPPGFRPQLRFFGVAGASTVITVTGAAGLLRAGFKGGAP